LLNCGLVIKHIKGCIFTYFDEKLRLKAKRLKLIRDTTIRFFATDTSFFQVFQRRQDGTVDFYRNWTVYKNGFGDPSGEFWLGW